jgi:hypothetical protein
VIYLFTRAQLENRISPKKVKRLYDDNSDGSADTDPVNQLRADASSKVRSYLEPMGIMPALEALFDQGSGELLANKVLPDEIVRLALDVAVAMACQRHPEVMRQDWSLLMKQADADLSKLRDGKTSLGGGTQGGASTPETGLHGGAVGVPGADPEAQRTNDPCVVGGRWSDFGDYG